MFKRKLISCLLLIIIICAFSFSGCSNHTDFTVYYGIDKMPKNLDPILASSFSEVLTARNCFRGLFKFDSNDEIVKDIVKDYSISSDGTKYTFILKDCLWDDGTPVTAEDFVFSLQRASAPETGTPYTVQISNIKGVTDRLNGKDSAIGAVAVDDKTLVITLNETDPYFLQKLTSPVFMPCNKNFFEKCSGKYGLDTKYILTNGSYKVSLWSDEKYIKLKRNIDNLGNDAVAEYVVLTESKTGKSNAARIKDKEISMATVSGEDYSIINTSNYNINVKYSKTYALIFNKSSIDENIITAFTSSIHREQYASKLNERIKVAYNIIPDDSILITASAKGNLELKEYITEYDPTSARKLYLEAINKNSNSNSPVFKIKYNGADLEIKNTLNDIISNWQSNLGVYISLDASDSDTDLLFDLNSNNFEIALIPLSNSVSEILNIFASNGSESDYGIDSDEYNAVINELNNATDLDSSITAANRCISIISTDNSVYPVVTVPTAYIYDSTLKQVHFSKYDGTVDFSIIYK